MKKYLTPAVIVALIAASLFLLTRNCGLTDKYKLARHDYEELKKITEADKQLSLAHIEQLNNAIAQANNVIVQKEAEITQKAEQIKVLSRDLADLIASEPSQPELESQPLVINLRGQVSKLTELYSLSQQTVTLQTEEIDVLKGKCIALGAIGDEWRVQYEKEHALRLLSEGLVGSLEKRVKAQGLLGKVKSAVIVGAAGYVAYSILK